jgi:hypothetical protein
VLAICNQDLVRADGRMLLCQNLIEILILGPFLSYIPNILGIGRNETAVSILRMIDVGRLSPSLQPSSDIKLMMLRSWLCV